jgi:glutaredoxin
MRYQAATTKRYTTILEGKSKMIKVYGKPQCPFCDQAKALLESRDVAYEYIDITQVPDARQMLVEAGFRSVPQIYRGTTHIPGGYQGLAGMSEEEFNTKVR